MKNLFKLVAVGAVMLAGAFSASAQRGFDTFAVPRTLIITPMTNFGVNGGVPLVTNIVDTFLFDGMAKVDISVITNSGTTGGALTLLLQTSQDKTNWTALANFALITSPTAFSYTNKYYGATNFSTANNYLLPGTVVTPTASSGFLIPYLQSLPFTNTGAITLNAGNLQVGYNPQDSGRYLAAIWNTTGGTITNFTGSAILTGHANGIIP